MLQHFPEIFKCCILFHQCNLRKLANFCVKMQTKVVFYFVWFAMLRHNFAVLQCCIKFIFFDADFVENYSGIHEILRIYILS